MLIPAKKEDKFGFKYKYLKLFVLQLEWFHKKTPMSRV